MIGPFKWHVQGNVRRRTQRALQAIPIKQLLFNAFKGRLSGLWQYDGKEVLTHEKIGLFL